MKCENLQFSLPLYTDDVLSGSEREQLEGHLAACPICRARLAEYQALKNELRFSAPAPDVPADLLLSVRSAVSAELGRARRKPHRIFSASFREWLQFRLMPYGVGVVASLVLTFSLLSTLLPVREGAQSGVRYGQTDSGGEVVLMAANNSPKFREVDFGSYEPEALDLPVGSESPRVNPASALLALTQSIVRGNMKDEEVVVVADVFGDGIARIAEVVEPPHDRRALRELERALAEDENYAPFVPAKQDKRSSVVRVILKIQRVDVIEKPTHPQKGKS